MVRKGIKGSSFPLPFPFVSFLISTSSLDISIRPLDQALSFRANITIMSADAVTKELGGAPEVQIEDAFDQVEHSHGADLDEKAKASDYKADAVEAENAEHNMGVLEAVKAYPMASFWAFIMSMTIVCISSLLVFFLNERVGLT